MKGLLEGKVIVVTGAGAGVGKGIAIEAARQGAKVIVNDLGVAIDGTGGNAGPAQQTVDEIRAFGGTAAANTDSVAEWKSAQAIIQNALDLYGRIDGVVNNAGNLRDGIFHKMSEEDFDAVVKVHLKGCFNMSRAASPHFKTEETGAFVHMTSTSGLIGNFGQANYGAAKLGCVGLAKTLGLEGAKYNIRVNSLAPTAGTRMTEDIFPEEAFKAFSPENVVPAALFLVSDDAPSGAIVGAGAGVYQSAFVTMNEGVMLPEDQRTADGFAAAWGRISDRSSDAVIQSGLEQSMHAMQMLMAAK